MPREKSAPKWYTHDDDELDESEITAQHANCNANEVEIKTTFFLSKMVGLARDED